MENNNLKILSAAMVLSSVILTVGLIKLGKSIEQAGSNARPGILHLGIQGNIQPIKLQVDGSDSYKPINVQVDGSNKPIKVQVDNK
jgi:hypothetical protein